MKSLLDYLTQCHSHINHCYQITGAQTLSIDSYFTDEAELQEFIDTIQKWGDYEIELVLRDILLSEGDEWFFSVTDTLTICRHKILCGFRQAFPNTKADSDTIIKCLQIIISL